jgi:hypothetical protein
MSSQPPSPSLTASSTSSLSDFETDDVIEARRLASKDQFDLFEAAIDLEATSSKIGFQEGKLDALKRTQRQGIGLGFEYGQELGEEIGFYIGFYTSMLMTFIKKLPQDVITGLPEYNIDYSNPALTITQVKEYNKNYFLPVLIDNAAYGELLQTSLGYSKLKYNKIITDMINILSLTQSLRFMPGETGDVHLIGDIRAKSKALFARMEIAQIFADTTVIDF